MRKGDQVIGKEPVTLTDSTSVGAVRPRSSTCSTCSISSAREGVLALVWQPEMKANKTREGRVMRITTRNAPRAPIGTALQRWLSCEAKSRGPFSRMPEAPQTPRIVSGYRAGAIRKYNDLRGKVRNLWREVAGGRGRGW